MPRIFNVLALIIPVILVVIIGAEVYYLFMYKSIPSFQTRQSLPISPTSMPKKTKGDLLNEIRSEYFHRTRLYATNSALISATRTERYEGKIIEIDTRGGVDENLDNFEYSVKLRIKGKGEIPNQLLFNKTDLASIKVVDKDNDRENPIKFADLKVGDNIILNSTLDLTKDINNNIVDTTIIRF